ncbi:MAG TPA: hypothetical protein VM029_05850 [Opitutaceae bacterium]|nr:hypothetical protein [Opitutaceae bacterium]
MFVPASFTVLSRRQSLIAWAVLAAVPVLYIAAQVVAASRNFVFWDEFDTALALILRINAGADWSELLQRFFAINNEHRMVTSRLLFAGSYWLTGTVNFHVIGALGNLFLVGACGMLVTSVQGWERRIRLGVVLAFLMFQLEHFENFLWSGASIDHFQVVMLAVAAMVALVRGSRMACALAILAGLLATFTLAHGCVVWPVGLAFLWSQRRWRHLAAWCVAGAAGMAAFLYGFELNTGHQIGDLTLQGAAHIGRYWLALLGGPLTLGNATLAPLPGLLLLGGLVTLTWRGAGRREPVALFTALFAVGALSLVAFGRSEIAGAEINSRYMVLGALAWAMVIYLALEQATQPGRPFRLLVYVLPALVGFNIAANKKFAPLAEGFVEVRDRAVTRYKQYGEDGRGIAPLHPQKGHAEALLKLAAERGVYQFPRVSLEKDFPEATSSTRIIAYVDEVITNPRAVTLGGWGMIPGLASKRGQVYVVLRSEKSFLIYSTVTLQRPDVAKAYKEPSWRLCGFRAVVGRNRLPAEDFQVGVLIADGDEAEFIMTPTKLLLKSEDAAAATARLAGQD